MFKHLFVPTDGSPLSTEAVQRAVDFAKEINARITFFYARPDYPVAYFGEGAFFDNTSPEDFKKLTASQAQETLTACRNAAVAANVSCTTEETISDVPYEAIIAAAEKAACDLIFMASHGRRGIAGLLLGSETQKVLTHTRIPVLVYR